MNRRDIDVNVNGCFGVSVGRTWYSILVYDVELFLVSVHVLTCKVLGSFVQIFEFEVLVWILIW